MRCIMTADEIKFFDNLAPKWDSMENISVTERIEPILGMIDFHEGQNVLDLGTGTGVLIPYLCERVGDKGRVVAVDISSGMLDIAKAKNCRRKNVCFENVDFEDGEICGEYDTILLYCVYPHLHKPISTLSKLINRNLREGGRLAIAFPTDHHFINNIHRGCDIESGCLPPAPELAKQLRMHGLNATCIAASSEAYLVVLDK